MAEKVGDAFVELSVRGLPKFNAQLGTAGGKLAKLGAAALKVGATIAAALAVRAVARAMSGMAKEAADAEETLNKFDAVFSSLPDKANNVASAFADSFGLAESSAKKLLADTGDILVGFGFAEDAALDLTKQVNELAVDLASFTNIEGGAARASQALTKLLVGETEQAKSLGIVVRQSTKEYKQRVRQIQETQGATLLQAKALANLQIALEQTQKAQGDFARTQDSFANRLKVLGERFKDLRLSVGQAVIDLIGGSDTIKAISDLVVRLTAKLKSLIESGFFIVLSERIKAAFKIMGSFVKFVGKIVGFLLKPFIELGKVILRVFGVVAKGALNVMASMSEEVAEIFRQMDANIERRMAKAQKHMDSVDTDVEADAEVKVTRKEEGATFTGFEDAIKEAQAAGNDKAEAQREKQIEQGQKQTTLLEAIKNGTAQVGEGIKAAIKGPEVPRAGGQMVERQGFESRLGSARTEGVSGAASAGEPDMIARGQRDKQIRTDEQQLAVLDAIKEAVVGTRRNTEHFAPFAITA